jgi:hypothetical protein
MSTQQERPSTAGGASFANKDGLMNRTRCISAKYRKAYSDESSRGEARKYEEYVPKVTDFGPSSPSEMKKWDFSTSRARPNTALINPFVEAKKSEGESGDDYSWRTSNRYRGQARPKSIRNGIIPLDELDPSRRKLAEEKVQEEAKFEDDHGIMVDHSTIDEDDGVDEIFEALLASNDHSIHFEHHKSDPGVVHKVGAVGQRSRPATASLVPDMDIITKNKYFGASSKVRYNATCKCDVCAWHGVHAP